MGAQGERPSSCRKEGQPLEQQSASFPTAKPEPPLLDRNLTPTLSQLLPAWITAFLDLNGLKAAVYQACFEDPTSQSPRRPILSHLEQRNFSFQLGVGRKGDI